MGQETWTRELGGTLAQFGDGAAVSRVSLPSDFSAVRLDKLPAGSSPVSVVSLLAGIGLIVPLSGVRVSSTADSGAGAAYCSADIRMDDPLFAEKLLSKIPTASSTRGIKAVAIPTSIPQGAGIHRVDCRKVHCSWHRATRTAWLNFGKQDIARKVRDLFNKRVYKVCGREVGASGPVGKANRFNPFAWTVTLNDLPSTADEASISAAIPDWLQPRHVELSKPTYPDSADMTVAKIQSLLTQIGAFEGEPIVSTSASKRTKMQVRFVLETDARKAVGELHNAPLPFNKTGRLTVHLVTSAKFKVLSKMYQAVLSRIDGHRSAWGAKNLLLRTYPPSTGFTTVKIEGEHAKDVAAAKRELEIIFAGEVAKNGEDVLWAQALTNNNGLSHQSLKEVEQRLGVFILRDKQKRQLRVYGPESKCQEATRQLVELFKNDSSLSSSSSSVFTIQLSPEQFRWACCGGFRGLSSALGDGVATFDVVSCPKCIIINGTQTDHAKALAMIEGGEQVGHPESSDTTALPDGDCAACWTEAENPVRTQCGHLYCAGCFENLCQSCYSTDSEFLIRCAGDEDRCKRVFPLGELQDCLSSSTFEDVLEASFASHVARNPSVFSYCPTPDCGQVYRTTAPESAGIHTCSKCCATTCTACKAAHEGVSCAEYRYETSDEAKAMEKLKKELGFKDCPECKTSMEKRDGCDHMTCPGCGTHICWRCLETFATGRLCYEHLNEKQAWGDWDRAGGEV